MDGVVTIDDNEVTTDTHIVYPLKEDEELYDGSEYYAQIASCNAAGLCAVQSIGPLLVDSTRPVLGGLTEHYPIAGGTYDYETWLPDDPMPWTSDGSSTSTFTIRFEGFADPHSELDEYHFKFGTTYDGKELSDDVIDLDATVGLASHDFTIAHALPYDGLMYVTIWVTNNVGQQSHIDHLSLSVVPANAGNTAGTLLIQKHSCDIHSCIEDCSCAIVGKKCKHTIHAEASCDETADATGRITVNDGWSDADEDITGNANCLRSWWEDTNPSGAPVLRYEWTFGTSGQQPGAGIFHLTYDKIWHDVNELTSVIHCTKRGVRLVHKKTYISYIRAWYTDTQYSIYTSDGIYVDHTPPQIRLGGLIKDLSDPAAEDDTDFSTLGDQLHSKWTNLFQETQSQMVRTEFSYGTQDGCKFSKLLCYSLS